MINYYFRLRIYFLRTVHFLYLLWIFYYRYNIVETRQFFFLKYSKFYISYKLVITTRNYEQRKPSNHDTTKTFLNTTNPKFSRYSSPPL